MNDHSACVIVDQLAVDGNTGKDGSAALAEKWVSEKALDNDEY